MTGADGKSQLNLSDAYASVTLEGGNRKDHCVVVNFNMHGGL